MFHLLSRLWSLALSPSNLLIATLALCLVASSFGRTWGLAARLAKISGAALCLIAIFPVGDLMLGVLESRFPAAPPPEKVSGIIILGGAVSLRGDRPQANEAADRLFVAAALARQRPRAKVLVAGGPINPATGAAEAEFVATYLEGLGVDRRRIITERRSADTFENARNAAELLDPHPNDRWLLVTSAFHMPRAVGAFRHAGFRVVAAPADWRAVPEHSVWSWSAVNNLRSFDLATREIIGLVVYFQLGRTSEVFPHPSTGDPGGGIRASVDTSREYSIASVSTVDGAHDVGH